MLVQLESVQNYGTLLEIISPYSLVVLKETDNVCLVLEDGVKMITINWILRGFLHKPDQAVQMLEAFFEFEERYYEHDMDQATKSLSKDKQMAQTQLERECYSTLELSHYPVVDL